MAKTASPHETLPHQKGLARPGRPSRDPPSRLWTVLSGVALSAAMVGAGYVSGRIHGWSELRETEAELKMAVDGHERAFANAHLRHAAELESQAAATKQQQKRAESLSDLNLIYEGFRQLQSALLALDARNFGIAEARTRDAEELLAPLQKDVAGLTDLVARLAATRIEVAGNLSRQRAELATLLAELDQLINRERSRRGPPATRGTTRKDEAKETGDGQRKPEITR